MENDMETVLILGCIRVIFHIIRTHGPGFLLSIVLGLTNERSKWTRGPHRRHGTLINSGRTWMDCANMSSTLYLGVS